MAAALLIATASACGSMVHVAAEREGAGGGEAGDEVAVVLRLRADALEVSISNLGETPVYVLWDKATLVDTDGKADRVVRSPGTDAWAAPDRSGDVSRLPPHATLQASVLPARRVVLDPDYGWLVMPLLPVECGPVQCIGYHELVGKTVRLTLPMEVEGTERVPEWTLRITRAERSSHGTRPRDPDLH